MLPQHNASASSMRTFCLHAQVTIWSMAIWARLGWWEHGSCQLGAHYLRVLYVQLGAYAFQ